VLCAVQQSPWPLLTKRCSCTDHFGCHCVRFRATPQVAGEVKAKAAEELKKRAKAEAVQKAREAARTEALKAGGDEEAAQDAADAAAELTEQQFDAAVRDARPARFALFAVLFVFFRARVPC